MSNYKLIAFDMDGTLLDSSKKIRKDSLDAMKIAKQKGKILALSTGRSMPELTDHLKILTDVEYVIGISGALVFNTKSREIIYRNVMEPELVSKLLDKISGMDVMIHIHSDESLVEKSLLNQMEKFQMKLYQQQFIDVCRTVENLPEFLRNQKPPVYKFNIYCKNTDQRLQIKKLVSDLPLTLAYSEKTSLECSARGISKGDGLIRLCQHLNLSVEQTIAVGDADNDLEILKTAGLAVGMGNCNENVRTVADEIVATNDEGGCAEAINRFLLNSVTER